MVAHILRPVVPHMGTSTSQRSPGTPEWERVQRLYDDPQAPPQVIVSRIVEALGPDTRAEMTDSAVARCLGTLVRASAGDFDRKLLVLNPALPATANLAAALRTNAHAEIAAHREASHFGELALDALSTSALEFSGSPADPPERVWATLTGYAQERRLSDLASCFISEDMARAFRYFVERDTPAHVGGRRLATVRDADLLADQIADICRRTTRGIPLAGLEDDLASAVERGPLAGHSLYRSALSVAVSDSLRALGGNP